MRILAITLATLLLAASCSHNPYRYVPAENSATNTSQSNEALYKLPKEHPSGSLRVQYIGIQDGRLQLRVVASNSAAIGDWQVSASSISVAFPNGPVARPIAANPSALRVQPGRLLSMDLYFALPQGMTSADHLPEFDVHWSILANGREITETTPFDRVRFPELNNGFYEARTLPAYPADYQPWAHDSIVGVPGGWWG